VPLERTLQVVDAVDIEKQPDVSARLSVPSFDRADLGGRAPHPHPPG